METILSLQFFCKSKTILKLNSFLMCESPVVWIQTENISSGKVMFKIHIQFSSVTQSCPILFDPMNHSTPGFPVHHQLPEFTKLMPIELVMPSSQLILCRPLLLLPLIPPSIRVFSSESALHIRWPKYCSFSFNISPSK